MQDCICHHLIEPIGKRRNTVDVASYV